MTNKKEMKIGIATLLILMGVITIINILAPISVAAPENLTALTISSDTSTVNVGVTKDVKFTVTEPGASCTAVDCPPPSPLPVSGALVQLSGAATGSGTTLNDGTVIIPVNAASAGDITATASKDNYTDGSTTITAMATEQKQLAITSDTSTVNVGVAKDVKFTVTDENSTPIKDADVRLAGAFVKNGKTGPDGTATININATNAGDITATASKKGYDDANMTISAVLSSNPELILSADKQTVFVGKQTNVTFNVTRKCGTLSTDTCANDNITFPVPYANINLEGVATGSGTTDLQGKSKISINATSPGTITATANLTGFVDGKITLTADYQALANLTSERNSYYYGELVNFTLTNIGIVTINPTSWIVSLVNNGWVYMSNSIPNKLDPGQSINLVWNQKNYNNSQVKNGSYRADVKFTYNNTNYIVHSNTFEIANCVRETAPTKSLNSTVGQTAYFTINLSETNTTWDIFWYINGTEVYNQTNVNYSQYINNSGSIGTWNVTGIAKHDCSIINFPYIWTVSPKSQPSGNSGGSSNPSGGGGGGSSGGGGGGGGVVSGENYNNIFKFERQDADLVGNQPVTYSFKDDNFSIYQVLVTGTVNEGDVGMRIEHLRNASSLVNRVPPGTVYANENVWLGSKRINGVLLKFRVKNSWMESNNIDKGTIALLRFSSEWSKLNTKVTGSDDNYTYFEAKAPGLSSFAVTSLKEKTGSTLAQFPEEATATINPEESSQPTQTATPTENTPGFEIPLVIGTMSVIYLLIRRSKK